MFQYNVLRVSTFVATSDSLLEVSQLIYNKNGISKTTEIHIYISQRVNCGS